MPLDPTCLAGQVDAPLGPRSSHDRACEHDMESCRFPVFAIVKAQATPGRRLRYQRLSQPSMSPPGRATLAASLRIP